MQAELGAAQDVGDGQLAIATKQHEDGLHSWRFDQLAAVFWRGDRQPHECTRYWRCHARRHHQRRGWGQLRVTSLWWCAGHLVSAEEDLQKRVRQWTVNGAAQFRLLYELRI